MFGWVFFPSVNNKQNKKLRQRTNKQNPKAKQTKKKTWKESKKEIWFLQWNGNANVLFVEK